MVIVNVENVFVILVLLENTVNTTVLCKYKKFTLFLQQKFVILFNRKNGKQCSGHGKCFEGKCVCNLDYKGDNCECTTLKDTCIAPGMLDECNGNGVCECGVCKCKEGYRGSFCEICKTCSGLCLTYEKCVVASLRKVDANATECSKSVVFEGTMKGKFNLVTEKKIKILK